MLVYVIYATTAVFVLSLFYYILEWRWQKRLNDLKNILNSLDIPQIELEEVHRVPFH